MEKVDLNERTKRPSIYKRESFIVQFASSKGPPQIVALVLLIALGFGATIGIVPSIMTDRFARLNHGYTGDDCSSFTSIADKPAECLEGSSDAQNTAAFAGLVSNGLTLLTSSLIGSLSDVHGRRGVLILGIFLATLSPLALLVIQHRPSTSPVWYYATNALTGLVNWMAVSLSALADVLPPEWRAPGVGLLMAGFMMGLCISPTLAILFSHTQVTVLSFLIVCSAFLTAVFFFPETLPPSVAEEARRRRELEYVERSPSEKVVWNMLRPFRELSILNRNGFFRLVSCVAFFSGMVSAGDQTLLIYYLEEKLAFTMTDVAILFLCIGSVGVFAQAVLLKPLNDLIGERLVVALCFFLASINNLMYGLAQNKATIFAAIAIGGLTGMAFPTISAIKANNVDESEQGRIQGALYSIQALASGIGPVLMRFVANHAKDSAVGSGSMFIFASCLQVIALFFAFALPKDKCNSRRSDEIKPANPLTEIQRDLETSRLDF